jgi:hypothetical protein
LPIDVYVAVRDFFVSVSELKVVELKSELKRAGLPTSGNILFIYLFSKIKNQEINNIIFISVVDFTWMRNQRTEKKKE